MDPFLQQLLSYRQSIQQERKAAASIPGYTGYVPSDVYLDDNDKEDAIPATGRYFDATAGSGRDYPTRSSPFERLINGNVKYATPQNYAKVASKPIHPSYAYFDDNDEYDYQSPFAQAVRPNVARYAQQKQPPIERKEQEEEVYDDEQPEVDYPSFFGYPIRGLDEGRYSAYKPTEYASSGFERLGKPVNRSSFRGNDCELPFTFKRQRQQPKPKVAKSQPMYIMDRYGNLYPYSSKTEEPVKSKPSKKEINANDLIRMLLGGDVSEENTAAAEDNEGEEEEEPKEVAEELNNEEQEQEAGEKTEKNDVPSIEVKKTPLTREGLAEILSQITKDEEEKEEEEEKEGPETTEAIPDAIPLLRKQSTVPLLNVHKTEDDTVKPTSKPLVVDDVKVSAPQLTKTNKPFSPPVNIYEFQSQYIVVLSLPGVSKEFVDIDYHPTTNELIIKGEAKNKYLSDDDDVANSFILKLSEQRFGNFERIIKIPSYPGIEDTKIKAKFLNGMLEIKLPKIDESKIPKVAKKITLEEVPDEELERESTDGLI